MDNMQILTKKEREIMLVIWDASNSDYPISTGKILSGLELKNYEHVLQTVHVILKRLEKKGFLLLEKIRYLNYYTPLCTKREYLYFTLQDYLKSYYSTELKVNSALDILSNIRLDRQEFLELTQKLNEDDGNYYIFPKDVELFEILHYSHPHSIYLLDKNFTVLWSSVTSFSFNPVAKLFNNKILPHIKETKFDNFLTYKEEDCFCLITYAFKNSCSYYRIEIVNLSEVSNTLHRRSIQSHCNDCAIAIYQKSFDNESSFIKCQANILLAYPQQSVEMLRTISMFIDYLCIVEENMIIDYKKICIHEYFDWFFKSITHITTNLKINFTYTNGFEKDMYVLMDVHILTKILAHILSDFIRFGANIPIVMNTAYEKDEITITIQGGGTLPLKAFEAFYSSTITGERCGNGLGLMLTRKMIYLLKGHISIEHPECGIIFKISIPIPPSNKLSKHSYKVDLDKLLFLIMSDSFSIEEKNTSYVLPEYKVI